jgi:hypothetical protein
MPRTLRATDGQASFEWVAIVAVVAGLLVLGAALSQGVYVGRTVTRQMARALCIVRSGDCRRDQEPCVVHSKDEHQGATFHLAVVKLGGGHRALLEQRSDGSVAVTEALDGTFGAEADAGSMLKVKLAGLDAQVGAQLEASIAAQIGAGRTWIVPSLDAAHDLLDDLRHRRSVPSPDATSIDGHVLSGVQGSVSAGAHGSGVDVASAGFSTDRRAGTRIDHRTGHRTMYSQWSWEGSAATAGGVLGMSHSAVGDIYGVEFDEHGRPIDLQVTSAGRYGSEQDLPGVVLPVVGMLDPGDDDPGRVFEVMAHLDLTERDNLLLARAVVDDVEHRRTPDAPAIQALRRRMDEQGTVEARVLGASSTASGLALEGALHGLHVGFDDSSQTTTLQLRAAMSRGLDGQWVPRDDCVSRPTLTAGRAVGRAGAGVA